MTSTEIATTDTGSYLSTVDRDAILRHLKLDPDSIATKALLLICERYGLDPLLKHMVLIDGKPYVTRDGYLHIAHRSMVLDGVEVLEEGDAEDHWWARVAVHRKDMSRPFTYRGRYPHSSGNKKFGPEMAVKCAEVAALRRAFNVTGIGAADERWDESIEAHPVVLDPRLQAIVDRYEALSAEAREPIDQWIADNNGDSGEAVHPSELPGPGGWWDGMEARLDEAEPDFGSDPQNSGDEIPRPTQDTADPTLIDAP